MEKYSFVLLFFMIVVGLPVILGVGGDSFRRWLRHKEKMAEALNAIVAAVNQLADRVAALEKRCR